jgi:hypothetical protein
MKVTTEEVNDIKKKVAKDLLQQDRNVEERLKAMRTLNDESINTIREMVDQSMQALTLRVDASEAKVA